MIIARNAAADIPADLAQIIHKSCGPCHKSSEDILDLSSLPAESDGRTWMKILDMVESNKMPPPARFGPIEKRFPLDPAVRSKLIEEVSRILGAAIDRSWPEDLNQSWPSVIEDFAGPYLEPKQLEELKRRFGGSPDEPAVMDLFTLSVCEAVAKADGARPPRSRRLTLPSGARLTASVEQLFDAVYLQEPTRQDVDRGVKQLQQFHLSVNSWTKSWALLCAWYLGGPQTTFWSTHEARQP
jgi:hypothetical protein